MPDYVPSLNGYLPTESIYTVPPDDLADKYVPLWWIYQESASKPTLEDFLSTKDEFFASSLNYSSIFKGDAFTNNIPDSEADFTSLHYNDSSFLQTFSSFLTKKILTSGDIKQQQDLILRTGTLDNMIKYGLVIDANEQLGSSIALQQESLVTNNKLLTLVNRMFEIYNMQTQPSIKETTTSVEGTEITEYSDTSTSSIDKALYEELNSIYTTLKGLLPNLSSVATDSSSLFKKIDTIVAVYEPFYKSSPTDDDLTNLQTYWQHDQKLPSYTYADDAPFATSLNIRNSIAALEFQNDSVRDNLRSTMFTFQEFYKTAGSLIKQIDTALSKLSAGIDK